MGTMPFRELLPLYAREEITDTQTLGYILQNLVQMEKSIVEKDKEIGALKQEVERLKAFTGMEPDQDTKPKKKTKRRDENEPEGEEDTI